MQVAKNDEIESESEAYDEFLAIDSAEQKEFEEYNNRAKKTIKRRMKDSVSTYVLSSSAVCGALLFQVIDII
jgi:low affinity Fe/Cu permease